MLVSVDSGPESVARVTHRSPGDRQGRSRARWVSAVCRGLAERLAEKLCELALLVKAEI